MALDHNVDLERISVVIPTKDRLPYLRHSLAVFLAEPEVCEVVVVIDGSEDGTREFLSEVARDEPRLIVHDNGRNRGTPYAKNRGVERATCPIIFMGEDDLDIESGFFATLLAHRATSGADLIAPRNIFRLESESRDQARARRDREPRQSAINRRRIEMDPGTAFDMDARQTLCGGPILGSSLVFHAVPFEERIRNNSWREETDFQISAQEDGYSLVVCPHAISYNLVIEGDRGGSHAAYGYRRVFWQARNNWIFLHKHAAFLREHFGVRSPTANWMGFLVRALASTTVIVATDAKRRYVTRRPLLPSRPQR